MAKTGRGQQRRSRSEWQQLLDEQRDSGLTAAAFCRVERLHLSTFRWWKRQLRRGFGAGAGFIPVTVRSRVEPQSGVIELLIQGHERRARIAHDCPPTLAVAVTEALRGEPCS